MRQLAARPRRGYLSFLSFRKDTATPARVSWVNGWPSQNFTNLAVIPAGVHSHPPVGGY